MTFLDDFYDYELDDFELELDDGYSILEANIKGDII